MVQPKSLRLVTEDKLDAAVADFITADDVSDFVTADDVDAAIDQRIPDTGWVSMSLRSGITGEVRFRMVGSVAEVRYDISASFSSNHEICDIPAGMSPSGTPTVYGLASFTTPTSSTGIVYVNADSQTLRAFGGDATRFRGGGNWFTG